MVRISKKPFHGLVVRKNRIRQNVVSTFDSVEDVLTHAKSLKMQGGVGPRFVHLSNDENDSLNKARRDSMSIARALSK